MSICAGCGCECSWDGTQLVDRWTRVPHRLTCEVFARDRHVLQLVGRAVCGACGRVAGYEIVRDRRGAIRRCRRCGWAERAERAQVSGGAVESSVGGLG